MIRYRQYGDELLLFELVNTPVQHVATDNGPETGGGIKGPLKSPSVKTVTENLEQASIGQRDRFEALSAFLIALGDDVQRKTLKYYIAFRRIKNFACVEIRTQTENIVVYAKVDPTSIALETGFTRDVRTIGHFGTGELEITIKNDADLERAKPLLLQSYEAS